MDLSKMQLRKILKANRLELTAKDIEESSQKIIARCIEYVPWSKIQNLHTYVPVRAEKEIDTWLLLKYIWANHPNIQTVVPCLNREGTYDSVIVTDQTEWLKTGVRIPRPKNGKQLDDKQQFDVIIVPTLGFDAQGYRLGHGKGWYDRFLATQPQALTIGLCYQAGFVKEGLPHEQHDIPLKQIITEYTEYINKEKYG